MSYNLLSIKCTTVKKCQMSLSARKFLADFWSSSLRFSPLYILSISSQILLSVSSASLCLSSLYWYLEIACKITGAFHLFSFFSEITVLLIVQCLKTNVSRILSNILIVYSGRASLVPVTLTSKMQKTTVTNFYKCNLYKTILLNFLITPKETKWFLKVD